MKFPWSKNEKDLEFVDSTRSIYMHYPIERARDVRTSVVDLQKKKYDRYKFSECPGMIDYSQLGYIVPAWVDMHIMANKAGVVSFVGSKQRGTHGFDNARRMSIETIDGFLNTEDDVPLTVLNFQGPWKVFTSKNISALVIPAWFHSTFFDDLFVWPGSIDYHKFRTLNFIVSPKRECKVHIKSGDPLLQVIPFYNKEMIAGYGPGTDFQIDAARNIMPGDENQYYRKNQMVKKIFNLFGGHDQK
jgi:hypothetical protein